jgi:adenylate kinase family enzyme
MGTAQRAPVYVKPNDAARVVRSLLVDTHVRAAGPDTAEWVRVRSVDPMLSGWVRRADSVEQRHIYSTSFNDHSNEVRAMGKRNYLIEGVSGTGKTTVAEALQRRGYHVLHGDRELKYRGDPQTGEPVDEPAHKSERDKAIWQQEHLLWDIDKVKSVIADHSNAISFFCGGSRNFSKFIDLFDGVFVLEVDDLDTLYRRLDERVARDPTDWGGKPAEKELVARLHRTKEDIPSGGIVIDATQPLGSVVDDILRHVQA